MRSRTLGSKSSRRIRSRSDVDLANEAMKEKHEWSGSGCAERSYMLQENIIGDMAASGRPV